MESKWQCSSNAALCQDPEECRQCSLNERCWSCRNKFTNLCSSCQNKAGLEAVVKSMYEELQQDREVGSIRECRETRKKYKSYEKKNGR